MNNMPKTSINMQEVKEFYFVAMMAMYLHDRPDKGRIIGLPGYVYLSHRNGKFLAIDFYSSSPHNHLSMGTFTIYFCPEEGEPIPIWAIQYYGYYDKPAIPFLKKALRKAIEDQEFIGGRGPLEFREGELEYYNETAEPKHCLFDHADGYERITNNDGQVLGYHYYECRRLLSAWYIDQK